MLTTAAKQVTAKAMTDVAIRQTRAAATAGKSPAEATAAGVKAAPYRGFNTTPEKLEASRQDVLGELGDGEIEGVAGGGFTQQEIIEKYKHIQHGNHALSHIKSVVAG